MRRRSCAVPMPLLPGDQLFDNYSQVLGAGVDTRLGRAGGADAVQQPGDGAGHRHRQDRHLDPVAPSPSSTSAFRSACFFFWMIFITLMLPVEVRIMPTFKVVADLGMLNTLCRPDRAADRLGHRDLPVPPVLPDRARRTDRGRAHRRRRADALLLGHPAAAVAHQHRGAVRDPVHLRLEPVSVAAADHHRRGHVHRRHRHQAHDRRSADAQPEWHLVMATAHARHAAAGRWS